MDENMGRMEGTMNKKGRSNKKLKEIKGKVRVKIESSTCKRLKNS